MFVSCSQGSVKGRTSDTEIFSLIIPRCVADDDSAKWSSTQAQKEFLECSDEV